MLIIMTLVMVSHLYDYFKQIKFYTLNMCSSLYANLYFHESVKKQLKSSLAFPV